MFWNKKKEVKEKKKVFKLRVLFKNAEEYRLTMPYDEANRTVLNELSVWFYKRKAPTHFLKLSNADGSYGVEVVVFNREEICMMSVESCEI